MFYTIYKTTNIINGKFYIGKHQTKNLHDGYLGSGKLLKRAIKKYGIDNFHKEILHVCESEKQMNDLEKILVVPDDEINYNLCSGGHGGFGYINRAKTKEDYVEAGKLGGLALKGKKFGKRPEHSIRMKEMIANGKVKMPSTKNRKLSDEHKEKLLNSRKGKSSWNKGIRRTEEEKRKISETLKNKSLGGSVATAPLL